MSIAAAALYCEAGPGVGLGHMARCIGLAEALEEEGARPVFVTGAAGRAVLGWMAPGRFASVPPNASGMQCDVAIMDDYGASPERVDAIRRAARVTVVFDDFGNGHVRGDFVISLGTGATDEIRPSAEVGGAQVLLGPAYTPLRTEVRRRREEILRDRVRRPPRGGSILVTAGGHDGRGLAPVFLAAVLASRRGSSGAIDVALGSGAASWPAVEALAAQAGREIRLHRDATDMAGLIAHADISVGPGGLTLQEKLCLGLPSIAVVVADNQHASVSWLAVQGCVLSVDARALGADGTAAAIGHALDTDLADPETERTLWRRGAALIDGLGARRIVLTVRPEHDRVGRAITLRRITRADAAMMLAWQREPGIRQYFRDPAIPDASTHEAWLGARLSDPFGICEIVLAAGRPVGVVRVDHETLTSGEPGEVSIHVVGDEQGKGVGTSALRALRRLTRGRALHAEIHPDNDASWRSFCSAGFRQVAANRAVAEALAMGAR